MCREHKDFIRMQHGADRVEEEHRLHFANWFRSKVNIIFLGYFINDLLIVKYNLV